MKLLRKHATSIVLITAALGLGAYVWLIDRDRPGTQEIKARQGNLLPVFRRDEIKEIRLEHGGHKATILRRDHGDAGDYMFHLVQGDKDAKKVEDSPFADQISVERLIQALEFATRLRKLEEDMDPGSVGLETPRMVLTVQMGGTTYRIEMGDEAKMPTGSYFAKLDGHGVFVIPGSSASDMLRPIDAYRTRRILPYSSTELASIEVESDAGKTRIERGPWGGFRVEVAGRPRVSPPVFDRLLRAFADASAERFLEESEAREALESASSSVRLTLVPKSGPSSELVLGGSCPSKDAPDVPSKLIVLVRKTPSPLYTCVPSTVFDDLRVPAIAFADRRLLKLAPDEVEELEIVRGDATLELARKGTGWRVRKPEEREISGDDVLGYLAALFAVEGTIVPDPDTKKLGLDPPRGSLSLRHPSLDTKKIPPQVIDIGSTVSGEEGPVLALRRKEDNVVLFVPATVERLLEPSTTLIRSTQLLSVNAQLVNRIAVTVAGGTGQVIRRKGAGFELEQPKGFVVDATLASDLFDAVSFLHAERWVADRDDGSFGLEKPSITVSIEFEGEKGEETRDLRLGMAIAEGRYARFEKDSGVFILPRSLETLLRSHAIDRTAFMIDTGQVQSLTLRSGGRILRIHASGDTWVRASGSNIEVSEQVLGRIRRAIEDLRAQGAVHLGPADPKEGMSDPVLRLEVEYRPDFPTRKVVMTVGRRDIWRNMNVHYVRREGIDATFAMAESKVRPLLELMAPLDP